MSQEVETLYKEMMNYIPYFHRKYPSIPLDDLEDILNWSFFKAYRNFDNARGVKFKSFFFLVTYNECKIALRYRESRKDLLQAYSLDFQYDNEKGKDNVFGDYALDVDTHEFLNFGSPNPYVELIELLKDISKTLPRGQRKIMDLFLAGYLNKEISKILGVSHSCVTNQRHSIMKKLVPILIDDYPFLKEYKKVNKMLNKEETI